MHLLAIADKYVTKKFIAQSLPPPHTRGGTLRGASPTAVAIAPEPAAAAGVPSATATATAAPSCQAGPPCRQAQSLTHTAAQPPPHKPQKPHKPHVGVQHHQLQPQNIARHHDHHRHTHLNHTNQSQHRHADQKQEQAKSFAAVLDRPDVLDPILKTVQVDVSHVCFAAT